MADLEDLTPDVLRQRAASGGAKSFASQGFRFLIRLASQILIARVLSPVDYGLIAMVSPFLGLLQLVGEMGLAQAVIQSRSITSSQINTLFWVGLTVNFFIGLVLAAFSPVFASLYKESRLVEISIILGMLFPVAGLSSLPIAVLNRSMLFGRLAIIESLSPVVALIVGLTTAYCGFGYKALLFSAGAETITYTLASFFATSWRPALPYIDRSSLQILKTGGHLTLFNLVQFITTTADNVAISISVGATGLGFYDKGYKFVTQPMVQLIGPAARVTLPMLSRLFHTDLVNYRQTYLQVIQVLSAFSTPFLLFLAIFASSVIRILLGQKWDGMSPIVSWLCLGALVSVLQGSTPWLFISQGRVKEQLKYGTATSIFSLIGFMSGLHWGAAGVAAGAAISFFFFATPFACFGATRSGPVTLDDIWRAFLPLVASALPASGFCLLWRTYIASSGLVALSGALIINLIIFFSVLLLYSSYRAIIKRILKVARGKLKSLVKLVFRNSFTLHRRGRRA